MTQPTETTINDHRYQVGVLDVKTQWRIGKRIGTGLMAQMRRRRREELMAERLLEATQNSEEANEVEPSDEEINEAEENKSAPPVEEKIDPAIERFQLRVFMREVLMEMSDADSEFIMTTCVGVCRRWDERAAGGAWRPILTRGAGLAPIDGDVDLGEMLELTLEVVDNNLMGFLFGNGPR